MKRLLIATSVVFAMFFVACDEKSDPLQPAPDVDLGDAGADVGYANTIQAILETNCVGCHSAAAPSAGVALDTFGTASSNADAALGAILSGAMPPSGALPDQERALFQAWIDQGTKP